MKIGLIDVDSHSGYPNLPLMKISAWHKSKGDEVEWYDPWQGQKNLCLFDQNILACREWKDLLQQLIDSKANVEFNGGLDIRLMTEEKANMIAKIRTHIIHFAWDNYEDGAIIKPKLEMFKKICDRGHRIVVYVLCGFKERRVLQEDIERIQYIRSLNFCPYVMLYDKEHLERGHILKKLQRWVNNKFVFGRCQTFEEYLEYMKNKPDEGDIEDENN